jgi:hypothetical protein
VTTEPSTNKAASHSVGKLCVGGDWACAHGDFGGLRYIAQQLADYAPEPVRRDLAALASACANDPVRAIALWDRVRNKF